jgi:tRNA (guanine37-N1)-methyltransferase
MEVPEVLMSGHHQNIALWTLGRSLRLTKERRPDLFEEYLKRDVKFSKREREIIDKYREDTGKIS